MPDLTRAPRRLANALATLGLVVMCATLAWARFAPPALWLDVRAVRIDDAREGEPIRMHVDRVIRQPVPGAFMVTARRLGPAGWITECQMDGWAAIVYRPGAALPEPLTLAWWTAGRLRETDDPSRPCAFQPGRWQTTTTWRLDPPGYFDRVIERTAEHDILPRQYGR